jgi:hypothetical protein
MRYLLTIPARNEAATISEVINEYLEEASRLGITLTVQVVDDNSTDDTFKIVKDMHIPIYKVETGSGLANVFRKEMELALLSDADIFIHVDADGQHSAQDLHLSKGYQKALILFSATECTPDHLACQISITPPTSFCLI